MRNFMNLIDLAAIIPYYIDMGVKLYLPDGPCPDSRIGFWILTDEPGQGPTLSSLDTWFSETDFRLWVENQFISFMILVDFNDLRNL